MEKKTDFFCENLCHLWNLRSVYYSSFCPQGAGSIVVLMDVESPLTEYAASRNGRLLSVSLPAPDLTPARFLSLAAGRERIYWRDGSGETYAGMGAALDIFGYGDNRYQTVERQASELFAQATIDAENSLAAPRLFGGFAFSDDFIPDVAWSAFHPAHFILPHYQLACHNEKCWLTINALIPDGESTAEARIGLAEALADRLVMLQNETCQVSENLAGLAAEIDYPLSYAAWERMIEMARSAFQTTELKKVVLSRICQVRSRHPIDTDAALAQLEERYPGCYTFLFEPRPGHAFLGAPPELLVRVQGAHLETMGLAGSAPRGATPAEDAANGAALLASAKDRHEHGLVVDALRQRLQPVTRQLAIAEEPALMTLSNIHHLHTPVSGLLAEAQGVLPLVELLHPTPALGGSPQELALAFIREHEPTLRGWYAAPVGWIDADLDGTFAVAIRSAVVQEKRAWLYAGGGIVPGSSPEKEWEETGWKFKPMLGVLRSAYSVGSHV